MAAARASPSPPLRPLSVEGEVSTVSGPAWGTARSGTRSATTTSTAPRSRRTVTSRGLSAWITALVTSSLASSTASSADRPTAHWSSVSRTNTRASPAASGTGGNSLWATLIASCGIVKPYGFLQCRSRADEPWRRIRMIHPYPHLAHYRPPAVSETRSRGHSSRQRKS